MVLEDKGTSDVIILDRTGKQYYLQQVKLAQHSAWFKRNFNTSTGSPQLSYDFSNYDPVSLALVLEYCYGNSIHLPRDTEARINLALTASALEVNDLVQELLSQLTLVERLLVGTPASLAPLLQYEAKGNYTYASLRGHFGEVWLWFEPEVTTVLPTLQPSLLAHLSYETKVHYFNAAAKYYGGLCQELIKLLNSLDQLQSTFLGEAEAYQRVARTRWLQPPATEGQEVTIASLDPLLPLNQQTVLAYSYPGLTDDQVLPSHFHPLEKVVVATPSFNEGAVDLLRVPRKQVDWASYEYTQPEDHDWGLGIYNSESDSE